MMPVLVLVVALPLLLLLELVEQVVMQLTMDTLP